MCAIMATGVACGPDVGPDAVPYERGAVGLGAKRAEIALDGLPLVGLFDAPVVATVTALQPGESVRLVAGTASAVGCLGVCATVSAPTTVSWGRADATGRAELRARVTP